MFSTNIDQAALPELNTAEFPSEAQSINYSPVRMNIQKVNPSPKLGPPKGGRNTGLQTI